MSQPGMRLTTARARNGTGLESSTRIAARVGLLLGLAAAIPGIDFVRLGPFRLWHTVVLVAVVLAFAAAGTRNLGRYRPTGIDFVFLTFVVVGSVVEYANSLDLNFEANYGSTIAPVFYYLAFISARLVVHSTLDLAAFLSRFILFVVPSAIIALAQFAMPEFGRWTVTIASGEGLERRLSGDGLLRAAGLFGHWTGAGFYFCAMIAAAVVLAAIERGIRKKSSLAVIAMVLGSLAAATTLTFSVMATVAVLVLMHLFSTKRKVPAISLIFVATIASIPLLIDQLSARIAEQAATGGASPLPDWIPSTIRYRVTVWANQTIPAIDERPWFGWGGGVLTDDTGSRIVPRALIWASAESQWLTTALGFGVLVALLLALLVFLALRATSRASRMSHGITRPFVALTWMAVLASFTVPVFTNRGFPLPFWIVVGLAIAVSHRGAWDSPVEGLRA